MSCEKPNCKFKVLPDALARKPTPCKTNFFSKPAVTPTTILLTSERNVPARALACFSALRGAKERVLSSSLISTRSEEHTSELQSRPHLVCRLLLEKKKKNINK